MKRAATAVWNGSLKEGTGHLTSTSGVFKVLPYTYASRFENAAGTNPEELIAAAHAGCFSMALSSILGKAGFKPDSIETTSTITFENGVISNSNLVVKVKVPGIKKEELTKHAAEAKETCPVSKVLNLKISMDLEML